MFDAHCFLIVCCWLVIIFKVIPMTLIGTAPRCENSRRSFNFSTNWSVNLHTSMSGGSRGVGEDDQPVYGILHDHHLALVPGPLFPLPMRQTIVNKLHFLSPGYNWHKEVLYLLLLPQGHLDAIHGHHDADLLLFDVLCLELILEAESNDEVRAQQMTRLCPELNTISFIYYL